MKKNHGQNTMEYLIFFAGVTVVLLAFVTTGYPTLRTKKVGKVTFYIKKWHQAPFLEAFIKIFKKPGKEINKQIKNTTNLDSYGQPSRPVAIPGPTIDFTGSPFGQFPICFNGNGFALCTSAGLPPGQIGTTGQCYAGTWGDPAITSSSISPPPNCWQSGAKCICDTSTMPKIPGTNEPACCIDQNSGNSFYDHLDWTSTCPTTPSQPDTCSQIEKDNPPVTARTGCYPGMKYDCWEVSCVEAMARSIVAVGYIEYKKSCDTTSIVDTCPGSDAGQPFKCQSNNNFTCTDYYIKNVDAPQDVVPPGGRIEDHFPYSGRGLNPNLYQRSVTCKPILNT